MKCPEIEFDGEEIMSNFDRLVIKETESVLKDGGMFSRYPGWNFNGKVWFNKEENKWYCEVWQYRSLVETISADSPEEIMSEVSSTYGYD